MVEEEPQAQTEPTEETAGDPNAYAIQRVRELVTQTQVIHREPTAETQEVAKKAKIDWQLHVWSPQRKANGRPLGMSDMGGTRDARPNDAAKARK